MKSLSKVMSVMLALSLAWIAGILVAGNRDISNFRGTNAFLTQVNFESCTKAQRADCDAERAASDRRFSAEMGEIWISVLSWALGPPAVVLTLTWFLFERGTRPKQRPTKRTG
jgi:hypothetical protein